MKHINFAGIQHHSSPVVSFRDKERCLPRHNRPPETDEATASRLLEEPDTLPLICPELHVPARPDGRPPIAQRVNLTPRSANELVGVSKRCCHLSGSTVDRITRQESLKQNLELAGVEGHHCTRSIIIKVESFEKSSLIREIAS